MTGKAFLPLFYLLVLFACASCATSYMTINYNETKRGVDSLEIHEGIISQHAQKIKYKRNGERIATIKLSEPVMVAQAEQEEEWGFFQFPSVGLADDGAIVVGWRMQEDSYREYGKSAQRKMKPMVSFDEGKTWQPQEKEIFTLYKDYYNCLSDGGTIEEVTPPTKDYRTYRRFPRAVSRKGVYSYYSHDALPEDLQGVYMIYRGKDRKGERFHASIEDPGLLRYAIGNDVAIFWKGNIRELADQSLVAGVYPTYYKDENGEVTESSVSFYQSKDRGHTWNVLSRILFKPDGIAEKRGENGFEEPAFEIGADSTLVCVIRTGSSSPMYKTISKDKGHTWSKPEPFTPNGVKPRLLYLKNGVLVLASGRPGLQLRFSLDGTGQDWTDPIDMIPFIKEDGTFDVWDVTCGYAGLLDVDKNSFYIVYSDFTTKNDAGEVRKSIWFRKIKVKTKKIYLNNNVNN